MKTIVLGIAYCIQVEIVEIFGIGRSQLAKNNNKMNDIDALNYDKCIEHLF